MISYTMIGDVMLNKQKQLQADNDLDYVYEVINQHDVNIYMIQKNMNQIYRVFCGHYYYEILGEKTIEKLIGRGFLSMEEAYIKYGVTEIPMETNHEQQKGFMKTFWKRGQH